MTLASTPDDVIRVISALIAQPLNEKLTVQPGDVRVLNMGAESVSLKMLLRCIMGNVGFSLLTLGTKSQDISASAA